MSGDLRAAVRPHCLRCEVPIYQDEHGVWRREATGVAECPRNPAKDGHEPLPEPAAEATVTLTEAEHLWLRDLRKHPDGEVRLYSADGKLVSGTWPRQVTASVDEMLDAARRVAAPPSEADIAAVRVEWSSRDSFGRVGPTYPPGQGSPYSAQSLLKVGGKPVYRLRTVYRDDVTGWQEFTGEEDPALFFTRKRDLAAAIAAAGKAER